MHDWLRRRPVVMDGILILMVLGIGQVFRPWPYHLLFGAALGLPLLLRRRFPWGVLAWCCAVGLAQLVFDWRPNGYDFALPVAFYTVAAYGGRRMGLLVLPAGIVGAILGMARWQAPGLHMENRAYGVLTAASPLLIAWFVGDNVRTRRTRMAELEERAVRLERERDAQAQIATAEERSRIARDLHDVVAHSVSVMVVQTDGASAALADGELTDVKTALEAIGTTGRATLSELRLALGVLRDAPASYVPQPGLDDLDALADRLRAAGRDVRTVTEGEPRPLSPGLALAAYRIVQEALTNVLKHAGPVASAEVRLRYAADGLRLRVEDDGYGPSASPSSGGHGLIGMRERAAMFGGSVSLGVRPGGGCRVDTVLPWEKTAPPESGPAQGTP
jgi:signal transduction histidine kinase